MERLSLNQFEAVSAEYDAAALRMRGISSVCSCSDWVLAAFRHLHGKRELFIYREGDSWLLLAMGEISGIPDFLQPMEWGWGFASPLIGEDTEQLLKMLRALPDVHPLCNGIVLTGLPLRMVQKLYMQKVFPYNRKSLLPGCQCVYASLEGGIEGFLGRRTSRFRSNLKNDIRKGEEGGIEFIEADCYQGAEAVFSRFLDIENKSHKRDKEETPFRHPAHRAFYQELFTKAAKEGRAKAIFARKGGEDVAYIFGSTIGGAYRGLQMSFDESYRHLGLGNILQIRMIQLLCENGINVYDMGMDLDYKRRWAEKKLSLGGLFLAKG